MEYFISAGEASGELHGANLIGELRRLQPQARFVGFGGPRMVEAGCRLLFPLADLAVMWFARVGAQLLRFVSLIAKADRYFATHRPDVVILIDYPGFNWWIARRAHARSIPVVYYVPPQLWAWLPWRVRKIQRYVDHVICSLPFEPEWYARRGVQAVYFGHPFFDEFARSCLDRDFVAGLIEHDPTPIVGILPGSRTQEVEHNLPTFLRAAGRVCVALGGARFPVACYREDHREQVERMARDQGVPVTCYVGRTSEIIAAADVLMAVSGSVGLEILQHATPACILYKVAPPWPTLARRVCLAPHISLVNLLAGRELLPEFMTSGDVSSQIADHLIGWLQSREGYGEMVGALESLRERVGQPGASARAAADIVAWHDRRRRRVV